jgi:hypothetical protein
VRRRLHPAAQAAILLLVMTSCSSGSGGTATATTAASSALLTAVPSGSVAAGPLDAQSTAWFDVLCPGLIQTASLLSGVGGTAATLPQQAIVGAVQQASTVIGDTATQLATLPPPTFATGEQVATGVIGAMQSATTQMTTSAATFAAIDSADAAALQAGRTTLQTELLSSLSFLRDLGKIDPAVTSEIAKIPSCSALTS